MLNQVGSYRLESPLGRGTSGVVYRAQHVVLGRPAAVKLLGSDEDPAALGRFLDEACALARLQHPGLVQIFDCGFLPEGGAFLAMELLDGELLAARLLRSGPLPLDELVEVARQLAEALEVVHDAGLVHRDIKPANIFLLQERGRLRVKLLDFGVAKQVAAPKGRSHTQPGMLVGTPYYMSPEQCRSDPQLDRRADVYALGALLFELACGRPPFINDVLSEVIFAHLYQTPPSLSTLAPELPALVDQVIMRALAKSPDDRFSCALALAKALEPAVSQPDDGGARQALTTEPMMETLKPAPPTETPTIEPPPVETPNATVLVKTIPTVLTPMVAAPLPRATRPMSQPNLRVPRNKRWPMLVAVLLGLALPVGAWQLATRPTPAAPTPPPAVAPPIAPPIAPPVSIAPPPLPLAVPSVAPRAAVHTPRPAAEPIAVEIPPDMALERARRELLDPFPEQ